MDNHFSVEVITNTPFPQESIYVSMHQCYSEGDAFSEVLDSDLTEDEAKCGELVVKHLLKGGKGHFGPLEGPAITFSCIGFPHSVISQARTHRIGVEFNVQSMRYTSKRFTPDCDIEEVMYLRPVGNYKDRNGNSYMYTKELRDADLKMARELIDWYYGRVNHLGFAPEHARSMLPYDIRQNFTVSFNVRSLMHFLDLRTKLDAQLEIRQLCDLMIPHFKEWAPEIADWYIENRFSKARLSP